MIPLNEKIRRVGRYLAEIESHTYHYTHNRDVLPYIVWHEDGEANSFHADDRKDIQVISLSVDYFTKTEFDPTIDAIQTLFNSKEWRWSLDLVQYEEDTETIHYSWSVEIADI